MRKERIHFLYCKTDPFKVRENVCFAKDQTGNYNLFDCIVEKENKYLKIDQQSIKIKSIVIFSFCYEAKGNFIIMYFLFCFNWFKLGRNTC